MVKKGKIAAAARSQWSLSYLQSFVNPLVVQKTKRKPENLQNTIFSSFSPGIELRPLGRQSGTLTTAPSEPKWFERLLAYHESEWGFNEPNQGSADYDGSLDANGQGQRVDAFRTDASSHQQRGQRVRSSQLLFFK